MGTDNIIEAVLMKPDGEILTANDCQNEDIFGLSVVVVEALSELS